MRTLSNKELELVKLAVMEGIDETKSKLHIDFKIKHSDLTVHQQIRLDTIESLLYSLFCEVVEDYGVLQSQYE
jgi:hypothetical protein